MAAKLFYAEDAEGQTLYSRIVPTEEHTGFLQEKWNELAEFLKAYLAELCELPVKTWLQGSYKFSTMLRPLSQNEDYDVDMGVYFCWDSLTEDDISPSKLKEWVQKGLKSYSAKCQEVKSIEEPSKERCGRIFYENQFHIDVPAYHLDEKKDVRRLATNSKGWETSDPKALYEWFQNEVDIKERTTIRRLVRYLKAWAILNFKIESRPSSILLMVLTIEAFSGLDNADLDDEDAFCAVVDSICSRVAADAMVENPVDSRENLNRLDEGALENFISQLTALRSVCIRAQNAEDEVAAALIWDEIFQHFMPLPSENASVEVMEGERQISIAPIISITVTSANGAIIENYTDEVPSVKKGCNLKFRIVNSKVIPIGATIDWVVRNEGEEASDVSDLGHARRATRDLENEERTAYFGRHFMDCIVRLNGLVIAVKRVPVYVKGESFVKPLPRKPFYRHFIRRRRR